MGVQQGPILELPWLKSFLFIFLTFFQGLLLFFTKNIKLPSEALILAPFTSSTTTCFLHIGCKLQKKLKCSLQHLEKAKILFQLKVALFLFTREHQNYGKLRHPAVGAEICPYHQVISKLQGKTNWGRDCQALNSVWLCLSSVSASLIGWVLLHLPVYQEGSGWLKTWRTCLPDH